jgi:hypothetical protein
VGSLLPHQLLLLLSYFFYIVVLLTHPPPYVVGTPLVDATARRSTIEKIALQQGFDPLNPEDWYNSGKETLFAKVFFLRNTYFISYFWRIFFFNFFIHLIRGLEVFLISTIAACLEL